MKVRNQIEYHVWGRYALFSDPITRMGGEKCSYMIPTYQAIKGITESIYFKPSIIWIIDEIRIMKPIRTESKNIRPISYKGGNTLSIYNYLKDVDYQVRAHFIPNENRPGLSEDAHNENKHHNIARRMVERGGRRDIFLGTRECQAYVEPCRFGEGEGFYDHYGQLDFGLMFHGFNYPDETGKNVLGVRFWYPRMIDGIVTFPKPWEIPEEMQQDIRPMRMKEFVNNRNFSGAEEEALREFSEGGEQDGLDAETL